MKSSRYSMQNLQEELEEAAQATLSDRVYGILKLAHEWHQDQRRESRNRKSKVPFIVHPVGTAKLVFQFHSLVEHYLDHDLETVVCVAIAHDLLEDTQVNDADIEKIAGTDVRLFVEALTKPPAAIAGKSNDLRNKAFLDQIVAAGPVAVFVKLCDSMHNLSRPSTTPPSLFRKAVNKARQLYLPLLERCSLGIEFAKVYTDRILQAERDAIAEEQYVQKQLSMNDLSSVITFCVAASTGKVPELHDIVRVVQQAVNAENACVWRVGGSTMSQLTSVAEYGNEVFSSHKFKHKFDDLPIVLKGDRASLLPLLTDGEKSVVYLIPVQIGPGRSFVLSVVFRGDSEPEWLTLDALVLVSQFLAHRLIVAESDRRARFVAEAARSGVQVDAELAVDSGLSPTDIFRLDRWRAKCKQAVQLVEGLVGLYLPSDPAYKMFPEMFRVRSRIKTVNSILRKLLRRVPGARGDFGQIEDIAGVRIVCPTLASIESVKDFLLSKRAEAAGCRLCNVVSDAIRDYSQQGTVAGYRALHLIFDIDVEMADGSERCVPCEVQLRTVYQDIWAGLAHDVAYTSVGVSKQTRKQLQTLSNLLQQCECLGEQIAEASPR